MRNIISRRAAAVLTAAVAITATPAFATPITIGGHGGPSFQVDPLYFTAYDTFGLTGPGNGADYFAQSPIPFLTIGGGAGAALSLSQALQEPVYQHPQDPSNSQNPLTNGGSSTSPTAALPFVGDSMWTFTNISGAALEDVLILFTKAFHT